jgi:hypothetical protein
MQRLFSTIVLSFLFLIFSNFSSQHNFVSAQPPSQQPGMIQPQTVQTQKEDQFIQELNKIILQEGVILESEIPQIKIKIQQAIVKISESIKKQNGTRQDIPPMISGVIILKNWLIQQKCIKEISIPLVADSGDYSSIIFNSFPGEVPISIIFDTKTEKAIKYRLLVYVSTKDIIQFASFVEDNKPVYTRGFGSPNIPGNTKK